MMDELSELRFRMEAMKKELENSHIINDRLLRTVMKQKSSWLNRLVSAEVITLPLFIFIIFVAGSIFKLSVWYGVIFAVFAVIDTAVDFKTTRIPQQDFYRLNLMSLREKFIRQKYYRKIQYLVSAPSAIIWLACFTYEIFIGKSKDNINSNAHLWILITLIAIIIIVALTVILLFYRKMQATNTALIHSIDSYPE